MRERATEACVLPQHVQCESARRVTATGAPSHQARPIPRTVSACTATVCAAAAPTGGASVVAPELCDFNNGCASRVPLKWGHQDYVFISFSVLYYYYHCALGRVQGIQCPEGDR